jgi:hypothetical protein
MRRTPTKWVPGITFADAAEMVRRLWPSRPRRGMSPLSTCGRERYLKGTAVKLQRA